MITNDAELVATQKRIAYFEDLVSQMRKTTCPDMLASMTSGYRAEIEKMQQEVGIYVQHNAKRR